MLHCSECMFSPVGRPRSVCVCMCVCVCVCVCIYEVSTCQRVSGSAQAGPTLRMSTLSMLTDEGGFLIWSFSPMQACLGLRSLIVCLVKYNGYARTIFVKIVVQLG